MFSRALQTELGFIEPNTVHVRMLARISDIICIVRLQFLLVHLADLGLKRFSIAAGAWRKK